MLTMTHDDREAALRKSKRSMSGSTLTSAANKRSCAAALLGLRAGRADCATIADNAPSGKHAANSERYLSPLKSHTAKAARGMCAADVILCRAGHVRVLV